MQPTITAVSSRYGAPMGRADWLDLKPDDLAPRTVHLFRVRLDSGGYDAGGAYWGHGEPLFCATDGENYREFTRARNREHAAIILDLKPESLKARLKPCFAIGRYSFERAFVGRPAPGWVVSDFGSPCGVAQDWDAVCNFIRDKVQA